MTVESIIIIGTAILILVTVVLPLSFSSSRMGKDVQHFGDARFFIDSLAASAGSISTDYGYRHVELYIPGFTTAATTEDGDPLIERSTRVYLGSQGGSLRAEVSSVRREEDGTVVRNDTETTESELPGKGWSLSNSSGSTEILESRGAQYAFNISGKNITFLRK